MTPTDRDLEELALKLGRALHVRGWRLAAAESCTGGWIAKVLTDVAGSSQWFDGGVVAYSNAAKTELLGVSSEVLAVHGAVSEETVRAMADGARQPFRRAISPWPSAASPVPAAARGQARRHRALRLGRRQRQAARRIFARQPRSGAAAKR